MAISALKFIGLTVAAVVLGVMSAAVTFGQFGPGISATGYALTKPVDGGMESHISDSETMRTLRHIIGR